jgi:hypothetical protein
MSNSKKDDALRSNRARKIASLRRELEFFRKSTAARTSSSSRQKLREMGLNG